MEDDFALSEIWGNEVGVRLQDMGISNPVEYFNDENMPSIYLEH